MRKVKWGVIGCGGIADRRMIPGMLNADNVELVAVMDTNYEVAERVKEKHGAKYAFSTVDELLELSEIEAVYIATPVFCHLEQVKKAAKAKKHILLEKPLGLNSAEAERIKEICEKEDVLLGAGFMMRYSAYHQKLKELVSNGDLGEIVSARAQFTCWYPEAENCWRQEKKLSGGGALMDLGIHQIDIIHYITGLKAKEVTAFTGNQIFKYGVEDSGSILMRLSNGAMCYVESNFNVPDSASVSKLEIYGTKGSACLYNTLAQEDGGRLELVLADDKSSYDAMQKREANKAESPEVDFANMYTTEAENFSAAITDNKTDFANPEDAIYAQKVVDAAYKSFAERKFIKI